VPGTLAVAEGVAVPETEVPAFHMDLVLRDQAIALLHIGAEVEHALMVQYLYAAYSLQEEQPDEATRRLIRQWRSVILEIAREEMGHLATVQNLLTVIGGPLSFDREDYPIIDPELWPFPFSSSR
jgi:rubrerythrin